jgi:hypothetical protein
VSFINRIDDLRKINFGDFIFFPKSTLKKLLKSKFLVFLGKNIKSASFILRKPSILDH